MRYLMGFNIPICLCEEVEETEFFKCLSNYNIQRKSYYDVDVYFQSNDPKERHIAYYNIQNQKYYLKKEIYK